MFIIKTMETRGAPKGERNGRWNGGNSEYPNHSKMKRIRKEVLKEANNVCHFCGGFANEVHHKDRSKNNHSKENFVASCHGCNHLKENTNPMKSKFRRLYGFTAKELVAEKIFESYYEIPEAYTVVKRLKVGL